MCNVQVAVKFRTVLLVRPAACIRRTEQVPFVIVVSALSIIKSTVDLKVPEVESGILYTGVSFFQLSRVVTA